MGEAPAPAHAKVSRWTLWTNVDEETEIRKLVLAKTDPFAPTVLNLEALLADLKKQSEAISGDDLEAKHEITSKCGKLMEKCEKTLETPGIASYQERIETVADQAEKLMVHIIRKVR
jgi:hypothetical protein